MRLIFVLALICGTADAGAVYDLNQRNLTQSSAAPVVAHYSVQDDNVRFAAADGATTFIVQRQTIYILDNAARAVTAERYATLPQIAAKSADSIKMLRNAAASASADQAGRLTQAAQQLQDRHDRESQPAPRDYRMTDRTDSVDGHACRIWEAYENGAKRLELCVSAVSALPGGPDVLRGIKLMSDYFRGSMFALGVEFGPAPWWSGIEGLGGVPILIREFKDGKAITLTTLTSLRAQALTRSLFELPAGYAVHDQPLGNP